jgi:carbamoyltransferase
VWVLGLAHSHNGAAALVRDGRVVAAIQLERLERVKRFPLRLAPTTVAPGVYRAINYCLREAGIGVEQIDAWAVSTPWRVPDAVHWPHGALQWVPHHLAHAEYVLHFSPQGRGLVLVVDAHGTYEEDRGRFDVAEQISTDAEVFGGDAESVSAYLFDAGALSLVYRTCAVTSAKHGALRRSVGAIWEQGSQRCFGVRDQAGKVMGLAAYGERSLPDRLLRLEDGGRLDTDLDLLLDPRLPFRNVAHEVQAQTTRVLLDLLARLAERTGTDVLYYTGGVALNVIANDAIARSGLFRALHMNGSCEDNGTAIGAALAVHRALTGERVAEPVTDLHGRCYSDWEVCSQLANFPVVVEELGEDGVAARAAARLASGAVVGWFQGRCEFGPRALGSRSILATPLDPAMRDRLNGRVKLREPFRPYAAAVLEDRARDHFDLDTPSPVMLRSASVLDPDLPAITHVDGTSRVQTVSAEGNPRLHTVLQAFGERTGKPVLLNTSLNVAGEPIAETPQDAILTLLRSEMDALVLHNYFVTKK